MSDESEMVLRVASARHLAEEWALVLTAEGLTPSVRRASEGFALGVPVEEAERAAAALSSYERENPPEPHEADEPAGYAHMGTGLAFAAVLIAFFFVTGERSPAAHWFDRGSADVERILRGELWRTVTALTLHADIGHVLANAIAGAVFLGAVCRMLGPGLGGAVVLLAGVGGNLVNALFYGSLHVSVGASTAVFGAVGVLGGLGIVRQRRKGARGRVAWMPIVAGVALLAMLGMGGERVDLWAHLFGFLVGGALGLLVALTVPRTPGQRVQWILGGATVGLVLCSWILAFS